MFVANIYCVPCMCQALCYAPNKVLGKQVILCVL